MGEKVRPEEGRICEARKVVQRDSTEEGRGKVQSEWDKDGGSREAVKSNEYGSIIGSRIEQLFLCEQLSDSEELSNARRQEVEC
jgi:hypothetical protein